MKLYLLAATMLISIAASAKEASWYYTQWIMSSGVKISDCSEINGGYDTFVKKLKPQMKSLGMDDCMESNSQGLKTNMLICPSPSNNGNMISGFWFKDKDQCEQKKKEMESK